MTMRQRHGLTEKRGWILMGLCSLVVLNAAAPTPSQSTDTGWAMHTIDNTSAGADGARFFDLNHDGRNELVVGFEEAGVTKVYLHPSTDQVKLPWPSVVVGKTPSVEGAIFLDLDGNGSQDVITFCEGQERAVFVHWGSSDWESLWDPAVWRQQPLPASKGRMMWMLGCPPMRTTTYNIDRSIEYLDDGRSLRPTNPIAFWAGGKGADSEVGFFKNPEGYKERQNPAAYAWRPVGPVGWLMSIEPADMDGDGDEDLLISDRRGELRGCRWLENPGRVPDNGAPWTNHFIGGRDVEVMLWTGRRDLNGDGLTDLHVAAKTPDGPQLLLFLAQDHKARKWKTVAIPFPPNTGNAKSAGLGDLDKDDDLDFVLSCESADKGKSGVVWMEIRPTTWEIVQVVDISGPRGIKFDEAIVDQDIDGDGDMDVVICEEREKTEQGKTSGLGVVWYENPFLNAH